MTVSTIASASLGRQLARIADVHCADVLIAIAGQS
jgi:hypothetical protein